MNACNRRGYDAFNFFVLYFCVVYKLLSNMYVKRWHWQCWQLRIKIVKVSKNVLLNKMQIKEIKNIFWKISGYKYFRTGKFGTGD